MIKNATCLILVEQGLKGTENQCLALAQALGLSADDVRNPDLKQPWRSLAPKFRAFDRWAHKNHDALFAGDAPDIVISGGRKAALAALMTKKRSGGHSFLIHVLNPRVDVNLFDVIVTPRHDGLVGEGIMSTVGALHKVTPPFLNDYQGAFEDTLSKLAKPRCAVLIGGDTTKCAFTVERATQFARELVSFAKDGGYSLMMTMSRRTSKEAEAAIRDEVKKAGVQAHIWDGSGENPYFDYLKAADAIICTNDSVSMASEALGCHVPVYVADIGDQGGRVAQFFDGLISDKHALFIGADVPKRWKPNPLDDMVKTTTFITERYATFRAKRGV